MLISVHLPKTAGSSFRAALADHFGERLILDYNDRPVNESDVRRRTKALSAVITGRRRFSGDTCIHGHFMPLKYRWLRAAGRKTYVIWLRDPIDRLASHYHYWLRDYDPASAGPLRRRMVDENWSLERFMFCDEMRDICTRLLWGFPFSRFDFVGITECYDTDLQYFAVKILGSTLSLHELNQNTEQVTSGYVEDPQLRKRLEKFHARDVALYRQALEMSRSRSIVSQVSMNGR